MKERVRLKINMGYWSKNKEHFCRKNRNTGKKTNHRKYSLHFSASHMNQNKMSLKRELGWIRSYELSWSPPTKISIMSIIEAHKRLWNHVEARGRITCSILAESKGFQMLGGFISILALSLIKYSMLGKLLKHSELQFSICNI